MESRGTGFTTRMLLSMINNMFSDKDTTLYIVVTPYGLRDCERLLNITRKILSVLGINTKVDGLTLFYEHKWNGETLFTRSIRFITQTSYDNHHFLLTRRQDYLIYRDI